MRKPSRRRAGRLFGTGAALLGGFLSASAALALDEQAGEKKAIEECERKLCMLLQKKEPNGDDLKCTLSKTWKRSTIKEADQATVQWGYGDARCSVQIDISRELMVAALTSVGKEYKFSVPEHTAHCVVEEGGETRPLTVKLAPKIVFKDGRAEKVWVNLKSIEGPSTIKSTLWTVSVLTDKIGLFHRPMVKAINGFINKSCPKKYPLPQATAKPTTPGPLAAKKKGS